MMTTFDTTIGFEELYVTVTFEHEDAEAAREDCGPVAEVLDITAVVTDHVGFRINIVDILAEDIIERIDEEALHILEEGRGKGRGSRTAVQVKRRMCI